MEWQNINSNEQFRIFLISVIHKLGSSNKFPQVCTSGPLSFHNDALITYLLYTFKGWESNTDNSRITSDSPGFHLKQSYRTAVLPDIAF